MSKILIIFTILLICLIGLSFGQDYYSHPTFSGPVYRVHNEYNPLDLHNIASGVYAILNLRIIRIFDLTFDLIIPGNSIQPLENIFNGVKTGYRKIPPNYVTNKFRELIEAFRIKWISVSDVISLGGANLSDGNIKRLNLLIDWIQGLLQDGDSVLGKPFGWKGLLQIRYLNKGIDAVQGTIALISHKITIYIAKGIDKGITGIERLFDGKSSMPISKESQLKN